MATPDQGNNTLTQPTPTPPTTPAPSTAPEPAPASEPVPAPTTTPPVVPTTPPAEPTPTPASPVSEEAATKLKEDIAKDVSEKVTKTVSESVIQKFAKALGLTKEEEKDLPKDPESLKKLVDEKVQEAFKARDEEAGKVTEETEKERQERVDNIVKGWHSQYESLSRAGKVPKIENAQDPNDKGIQARRKLILAIGRAIDQNKQQGIQHTPTVGEVLLTTPDVLTGPPGGDLPISGNTQVREESDSFTHEELRKESFEEIAEGA